MADGRQQEVDLGHYLGQIASAAMHTHGVEGIRLDLKVDYLLMSINIAMPVGLVVNELLTNAFKYAFNGRASGIITLRCVRLEQERVQILVADDGIGLPEGVEWPPAGKIAALMLRSLRENAKTEWKVETAPNKGTRITLAFSTRLKAQPDASGFPLTGPFLVSSETTAGRGDSNNPSGSAPL
jgi:two-component sensor histidine kinase